MRSPLSHPLRTLSLNRRQVLQQALGGLAASALGPGCTRAPARLQTPAPAAFEALERRSQGRLGVAILDWQSGELHGHRAEERFPMCSTFKVLAAAAVLARVDRGAEQLDRRIAYGASDLLEHAPVTRERASEGGLPIVDLCAASMIVSDNTAANLLLTTLGGPAGLTAWLRALGDGETRLDRNEPDLNEGIPGDPRDTTTPAAMARTVAAIVLAETLLPASRERLAAWMIESTTGRERLRAGLPSSWRVGDRTGTSGHATNDVAVLWPPSSPPLVVAAYLTDTSAPAAERNAVFAELGRQVGEGV